MLIDRLNNKNIDTVFNNLSTDSIREIESLGKTVECERLHFHSLIGKEFTGAFLTAEKVPMALIALEYKSLAVWQPDLVLATGAWDALGYSLTKFIARFSSDFVERTGLTIEAYSPHGDGKWFAWYMVLGFILDTKPRNGLYRYYK